MIRFDSWDSDLIWQYHWGISFHAIHLWHFSQRSVINRNRCCLPKFFCHQQYVLIGQRRIYFFSTSPLIKLIIHHVWLHSFSHSVFESISVSLLILRSLNPSDRRLLRHPTVLYNRWWMLPWWRLDTGGESYRQAGKEEWEIQIRQ